MRASKQNRADKSRLLSERVSTLHQRLRLALNLGLRTSNDRKRKWGSTDMETQKLVVRSASAFLDIISAEILQHASVKESVVDLITALKGILHLKNEAIIGMVTDVALKLISVIPNSMLQNSISDLADPFSSLLSSDQLHVVVSCARALNLILSKLSIRKENEVWEILQRTLAVTKIVHTIRDFPSDTVTMEFFKELVSLLGSILWRWPPSRYYVWKDTEFMKVLKPVLAECDISAKIAILHLYRSIALCGNGARKLMENGEEVISIMVFCMDESHPDLVRMQGFKLAQCLATNEKGCMQMLGIQCEPIVKAIVSGMSGCIRNPQYNSQDRLDFLVEACRLALVTRWAGEHHICFWKLGIKRVLLDLLLPNFHKHKTSQHLIKLETQVSVAEEGLKANHLQELQPYVWDILGWLVTHYEEEFNATKDRDDLGLNMLITCACVAFVDSIRKSRLVYEDATSEVRSKAACRTTLMMIYSPCKYISVQAETALCEVLKFFGDDYLKYLINSLDSVLSGNLSVLPDTLQVTTNLMGLVCYAGLPQYQKHVVDFGGTKILLTLARRCFTNTASEGRVAPHLHKMVSKQTCCWEFSNDWEGSDNFLLFSLWGLAEILHYSVSIRSHPNLFSCHMGCTEAQLVNELEDICIHSLNPGVRWNAAYALCHFGVNCFPSRLGETIGKLLKEEEHADLQLIFPDGRTLSAHGVILMARCPSLLPPKELASNEKTSDSSRRKSKKEVRLSANVDYHTFFKLLGFVYSGKLVFEDNLLMKLKMLARRCNLPNLLNLLCRKRPKWSMPFPKFDLELALGPVGHKFSDIIVEAKGTDITYMTCTFCSLSVPHIHVHKVILCSRCDYLEALFQSGMRESQAQTLKVPIGWHALKILVHWFYSDELLKPISGCFWDNLDTEGRLQVLVPYVELCWLADFWFLDDIWRDCSKVLHSCLDSDRHLSVKLIQVAAKYSQWNLAETAANYMAPLYRQLCDSGDLDVLDDELVEMVRAASVRLLSGNSGS